MPGAGGLSRLGGPVLPGVALAVLREIVAADRGPDLADNVDPIRFPDGYGGPPPEQAAHRLADLLEQSPGLETLFHRLEVPGDRELLARVLAFRVLGNRKVQLPMTLDRLLELRRRAHAARTATATAPIGIFGWYADDYDLAGLGYPIRARIHEGGVVAVFGVEQYRCTGAFEVAVHPGDVVIDGGACWGDTALYFAHLAGSAGRVVGFEFEPGNLELLRHNLGLNPQLAGRISVVGAALSDRAGRQVAFRSFGPGTALDPAGEGSVGTETIDGLLERGEVDRVDFIKLDIEGAELSALRGAENTLRRFRPSLAIAAYHRDDDLAAIPAYLIGLGLGYRFRLRHTTMHSEETMLFARAGGEQPKP